MKNLITLFALIFTASLNAQTEYKKEIINGKLSSLSGNKNEDLNVEVIGTNGKKSIKTFKFTYDEAGKLKINEDAGDVVVRQGLYLRLNPKYFKRKAKITCRIEPLGSDEGSASIYWVEKIDWAPLLTHTNTSCSAQNMEGMGYIVEDQIIYELDVNGEKQSETWNIQNKDEICVRGTQCIKVKPETNGCVKLYNLPNITEVTASLKIVGDKIYRTVEGGCEADLKKEFLTFKGSKTQIALIAVIYRLGMGH